MSKKLNIIYFSAAGTTQKIARAIACGMPELEVKLEINLISVKDLNIHLTEDDFLLLGVPVYAGRVPKICAEQLSQLKGTNTKAIIFCTYGNREFDDTLLELSDIITPNGFQVISAAAFIAQHSIFPALAEGRPNEDDIRIAKEFGSNSLGLVSKSEIQTPEIKGNRPYRPTSAIPIKLKTNGIKCNACGLCASECPVGAIDPDKPSKTDMSKCIKCAHCISVCPTHARRFGGFVYMLARRKFVKTYALPKKKPYISYGK